MMVKGDFDVDIMVVEAKIGYGTEEQREILMKSAAKLKFGITPCSMK